MEKPKVKVLVNNTIMMYLLSIAKLLIPLISLPYLTRVLSVDCYGSVSFVKSLIAYMQVLVDFGFLLSGTKDIIDVVKKNKSPKQIIGDTLYAQILLSILSVAIIVCCCFGFDLLHGYKVFTILSVVPVILSAFLFEYVFKAYEQMGKIAIKFIIMKVVALILTILFVKNDATVYLMPIFDIVGSLIVVVMTFIQLHKMGININFSFSRIKNALQCLKNSFVYFISNFATTAFTLLNTLIIGVMLTKSDVAYWNVTMQLVTAVQALYAPIINSVFPTMLKEKDLKLIHKILLIYMPLIFIGCGLILILGDWGVSLVFTSSYLTSSKLLKYLIPLLIFSFPGMLYGWPCLGAIDKQKSATFTTIFSSIIQVLGLVLLICINQFNLLTICLIRNITEFSLFLIRFIIVYKNKHLFNRKYTKLINEEKNMIKNKSDNTINEIQKVQLDILIKFDEVCKKLNLHYSLSSGTLLGAVRHKGFIPWDDDIDVCMVRADYEKFIKEAPSHFPEGYFVQHFTTNKYATNSFVKIRNSNTTWITCYDILNKEHNMGFGMDVFPIDRIENHDSRKKLSRKMRFYDLLRYDYVFRPKRHKSLFKKVRSIFTFILARILGRKTINKLQDYAEKKFSRGEFSCGDDIYKFPYMPYCIFEEYSTIEFEGIQFSCIKDFDTYLTAMYGDYMQLPPIEERKPKHGAEIIDCNKSYLEYLNKK